MAARDHSDEAYILALCDEILGMPSQRQARFDFLRGDPGKRGIGQRLRVDAYYPALNLVVEYREIQHSSPVNHFDKPDRLTVSGVHRGEQRRIYDERRRTVLPANGITIVEIDYAMFAVRPNRRLDRQREADMAAIREKLSASGIELRG